MSDYGNLIEINRDVRASVRPPRRISVSQAAADVVRINTPGGYSGPWDASLTPYMVEPMDTLKSRHHEAVVFVAPARSGKALALSTRIPTPSGWTTMRDIRVGDTIFDGDGEQTTVVFATEIQHNRQCYIVKFSDGEAITADADHLWSVQRHYWAKPHWRDEVKTTEELINDIYYSRRSDGSARFRYHVKTCGALDCEPADLTIDPYLLGIWLGDGQSYHASIAAHKDDVGYYLERFHGAGHTTRVTVDRGNTRKIAIDLRDKLTTHCQRGHEFAAVGKAKNGACAECLRLGHWRRKYGADKNGDVVPRISLHDNTFQSKLRRLGLIGKGKKHIPSIYLRASIEQRYELLRGLMDTDGSCDKRNASVEFSGTHWPTIHGFTELARSLGFKPVVSNKNTTWTHRGVKNKGVAWRVCFPISKGRKVFNLPRKAESVKVAKRGVDYRQIIAIIETDSTPVRCIKVDSDDHVFLAGDGMIPTHNTQGLLDGWLSHMVTADPGDAGFYFSTQALAQDYRKRRVERLHRSSPQMRTALSPRSHDTTIAMVTYRNGMILNLGWPTSSQLAQRDLRYVALSDYDSFPDDVGGEGSPFDLARKRIQVAMSAGMALVESSPKRPVTSSQYVTQEKHEAPPVSGGILPLYNRGDQRRWYWQCIDGCGEWFECPALPNYTESTDISVSSDSAHIICQHCGHRYGPDWKNELNAGGRWIPAGVSIDAHGRLSGTPKRARIASFWILGCAAAFQKWESIVANHLTAKRHMDQSGDESALAATTNTDQGLPYRPQSLAMLKDSTYLDARREAALERYIVPHDVRVIFTTVDVQASAFEVAVWGYGPFRERWLIDRFAIRSTADGDVLQPAAYIEHWRVLIDRVVNATYRIEGGMELRAHRVAVDSGGRGEKGGIVQVTSRAYDWWRQLRRMKLSHKVWLVKGESRKAGPSVRKTYPDASKRNDRRSGSIGDVPVLMLRVDALKDAAHFDLQRDVPGPGYIHLPEWLPASTLAELAAEKREPAGWQKVSRSARNETWDLLVYADALWLHEGCERINWDRPPPWAAEQGANSGVMTKAQRKAMQKPRKKPRRSIASDDWSSRL